MACGTIKDQRAGVDICDVGLKGDAPQLSLGESLNFEDRRLGHSDFFGAAVKYFDLAALANFPPLRRNWLSKAGTMSNVRAGSRTLCSSLAIVVAGVGWPSARTDF